MLHALIMAGGAGTRFWPSSRQRRPKQLLKLAGDRSMIQATIDRLGELVAPDRVLILTNEVLTEAIGEQLPELPSESILGEPCKRDTAPCVALAAGLMARRDPEATMVVLPADHVIQPVDQFQAAISRATRLVDARPGSLVTFGIPPTYPAPTYGYIERGEVLTSDLGSGESEEKEVFQVRRFREKPSIPQAEEFLASGGFYWNAGIFVWKARTIVQVLTDFEPEMMQAISRIVDAAGSNSFPEVFRAEFEGIRGKSIDYAVLERYDDVVVMPADFQWDDVGNWQSLARTRGTDSDGNTIVGNHVGIHTRDSIVCSDNDHLVVTLGLKDCIIVQTPDATLVADKNDEEAMRQIVPKLRELGWEHLL